MSAENGILTITFPETCPELGRYISKKRASIEASGEYLPDEVCEWSFLEGWNESRGELSSQLIVYDSIYCVEQFCKEVIRCFPDYGFCGSLSHDWVGSDPAPTYITFMHKKGTQTLLWCSCWWSDEVMQEAFDDALWSGNVNDLPPTKIKHWRWDAVSDKTKGLPDILPRDYYAEYLFMNQTSHY